MWSVLSSARLGGSMGGDTPIVLLVLDGGDVLRRGAEGGVVLVRVRLTVEGAGVGAAPRVITLDVLRKNAPRRTR